MIARKKRVCKGCSKEKYLFGKGLCETCYKAQQPSLNRSKIKSTKQNEKTKEKKAAMADFFKEIYATHNPVCQESGRSLVSFSHFNMAHIFPKRRYLSISTDPRNILILELNLHTKLDNYLDKMDISSVEKHFPNSFPLIKERVLNIIGDIREEGKLKEAFVKYLNIGKNDIS